MNVLIVYHTFTKQASRVAESLADAVRAEGHQATACRIDFADPTERHEPPVPFDVIKHWGDLAKAGSVVPVTLTPEIDPANFDRVILLSNTWNFHPAVPIQSLLRSELGPLLLGGKDVAIGIVCRGFYKKNLAMTKDLVAQCGGKVIAEEVFTHAGAWLTSTIVNVMGMTKSQVPARLGPIKLPPFGVSPPSMAKVPGFAKRALA